MTEDIKKGERREVTVVVADMKGFTTLSERIDPEELDALMSRIFTGFTETINALGGTVEKYIGDAIVAVFGVPELHDDDPSRALHAAFGMLDRARGISTEYASRGVEIVFRIGVHTGLITTGRRGDYDVVTGHAMSVAQRLEAAAPPNGVLVSDATRERCKAEFEFGEPFELFAKGKVDPILACGAIGLSSAHGAEAGPFVGRRELLDEMMRSYIKNDYNEVSGFFLTGEAGIGKTRAAQALLEKIRRFPDFTTPVFSARALKYRALRFAVPVDIILEYLGLDADCSQEAAERELAARLPVGPDAVKGFGRLHVGRESDKVDPDAILTLYTIFDTLLKKHARDMFPILVFIDNADYMDRMSVDFFAYFLKNGAIKPFFVLAARELSQDVRKAFKGLKNSKLGPLSDEESREFIRASWPDAPEGKLVERILESCLGNPLFLREYLSYAKKHLDASQLPASIQNIFLTSLDRYPLERREFLKKMAVFSLQFDKAAGALVQERTGGDPSIVEESILEFQRDGILVKRGEQWSFRLDVFKQAMYESLLNHNKRVIHGIVADMMLAQEQPHLPRLIHHLVRSERWEDAARVIEADGNKRYNYDYHESIDTIIRNVGKTDRDTYVRLLITKTAQLFNMGCYEDSEHSLKQIIKMALSKRDFACMGYAYHQLSVYNAAAHAFQKASFTAKKALYYYRKCDAQPINVQHVLETLALVEGRRNNFDDGRRYVEACAQVEDGHPYRSAATRAEFCLLQGDYRKALTEIDGAIARLSERETVFRFFAQDVKVRVLWQLCDFESLVPEARKLLEMRPLSEPVLAQTHAMLAAAAGLRGDATSSRDAFLQAGFYADQIRNDYDHVESLKTIALCRAYVGDAKEAEAVARDALVPGLRHSCYATIFTLLVLLSEIYQARGKTGDARFFHEEASFCLTSGLHFERKDLAMYHHLASLLFKEDSKSNKEVALGLLAEESGRIGDEELAASLLALRSFGAIER